MLGTVLVFLVALLVFLCCWWYLLNYKYYKNFKHLKGPTPLPIIGNALHFTSLTRILPVLMEMKAKYGKLYPVTVGFSVPSMIVSDPKFLEFLLGSTKILDKSADYRYLDRWLGTGLLTSTGWKWRKHRKIITPAFHFKILEEFVEIFEKNAKILVENFKQEISKTSFDVYPYVTLLALDIICETALGTGVNAQINAHSEYVNSVKDMCKIAMERSFNPFLHNELLYKFTNVYRREKKVLEVLHGLTTSVIKKKKKQLLENRSNENYRDDIGMKKRLAFLDLLLQADIDGQPLSDTDLREEVDTFMFEGHDTTASAISFTLYLLSKHWDIQNKVMNELLSVCEGYKFRSCTYADLQRMKYLEAVIKEALRLYPSVPLYARQVEEDVVYEDILFPRGTRLTIFAFGIHRDPELFPEPEKFNPNRFLQENGVTQYPYAYIPFSAGPRNCIGQKFAMLEMKCAILNILRAYEILPAEPTHELALSPETTLKSQNGIKIRIRKRRL